jgi:hypothetical protein
VAREAEWGRSADVRCPEAVEHEPHSHSLRNSGRNACDRTSGVADAESTRRSWSPHQSVSQPDAARDWPAVYRSWPRVWAELLLDLAEWDTLLDLVDRRAVAEIPCVGQAQPPAPSSTCRELVVTIRQAHAAHW